MQQTTSNRPAPYLISLKWRALIIFSLLLLGISVSSTFYVSRNLLQQFEQEREILYTKDLKVLDGLLRHSSSLLLARADIVPAMSGMEDSLLSEDANRISRAFDSHWQALQLAASIDAAQLYDVRSELIQSWKSENIVLSDVELIRDYVRQVNQTESPQTFLDCANTCMQFAVVPMLTKGKTAGVIVLGATLATSIVSFKETSGVDIGILNIDDAGLAINENEPKNIGNWQVHVSALTRLEQNLPLLQALAARQPGVLRSETGIQENFAGRDHEINFVPVQKFSGRGKAYFVLIDDITQSLDLIQHGIRQDLFVGLAGLILSELILLLILWGPLSRLRRIALLLPLLAQNAFGQIRQALGRTALKGRFRDEFDVLEEEIVSVSRQLEALLGEVARRTDALNEANKELEGFAYSVAHDLRTPLRAIDGFSGILQDEYRDKLDEEGRRLLKVVRENTVRMGQLIDDILQFSRTGRQDMNMADIDMEALARSVLEELLPADGPGKLQVEFGHLPHARGDRAMLRQVFVNLLSNAIKFSGTQDAPKVEVGSRVDISEAVYFVRDNGVGFDMQYVDKLFGVFQRLHAIDEFEGTGIGLAIVKRVVTRHGGRVWAEGKLGEGATIYFTLPIQGKKDE